MRKMFGVIFILLFSIGYIAGCASTLTSTDDIEQKYRARVDTVLDKFYYHRKEYNSRLELIGTQARSATNETELRLAIQQALAHLQETNQWVRQDRDDFVSIVPPSRFQEFHLLIVSVLNDYVEATNGYVTYYSLNLNQGIQDLQMQNRLSGLLRTANGNLIKATYMYRELLGVND